MERTITVTGSGAKYTVPDVTRVEVSNQSNQNA
jgi:hypothetical protein